MNDDDKRSIESSGDYWPQHYSEESEAKKDPRWKSFAELCRRKGGTPMLKGFNTWLQKQPSLKRKQIQHSSNGSASYQDALIASMHRGDIENEVPIALRRPL